VPGFLGVKKEKNSMSVSLAELKDKNITDLAKIAKELNIPGSNPPRANRNERLDLLGRRP
jgi:hypothetical protein